MEVNEKGIKMKHPPRRFKLKACQVFDKDTYGSTFLNYYMCQRVRCMFLGHYFILDAYYSILTQTLFISYSKYIT